MIVDDNMNNLKVISYLFENFRDKYILKIFKAEDGNIAVNLF
jgi:hypothetical protein